jgi:hypothetical protein
LFTDISGQRIGPIFTGKESEWVPIFQRNLLFQLKYTRSFVPTNIVGQFKKIGVGSVGVTTAEVFGGKRLTQAVLSGRGVCRVGKKEMSARNLHFFYFIYF